MQTLVLSGNKAVQMPNIENTLTFFFSKLLVLDVSDNQIQSIEAVGLCRACPCLEKFNFCDNQVADLDEVLPLGKMRNLSQLNFLRNPLTSTEL